MKKQNKNRCLIDRKALIETINARYQLNQEVNKTPCHYYDAAYQTLHQEKIIHNTKIHS